MHLALTNIISLGLALPSRRRPCYRRRTSVAWGTDNTRLKDDQPGFDFDLVFFHPMFTHVSSLSSEISSRMDEHVDVGFPEETHGSDKSRYQNVK